MARRELPQINWDGHSRYDPGFAYVLLLLLAALYWAGRGFPLPW